MTARYGPSLIAGKAVYGRPTIGYLGSEIPSSGTSGPGFIYPDLNLPADAGKKYRGQIIAWPSAGVLEADEDTSFVFSGAPDGAYTFTYRLWEDGVDRGTAVVTLNIGTSGATANGTTVTATATLLSGGVGGGSALQTLPFAISIIAGSASGTSSATAPGAALTVFGAVLPGSATGSGSATVSGATLALPVALLPGVASGQGNGTAVGATFGAAFSFLPGSASATNESSAAGALFSVTTALLPGSAAGQMDGTAAGVLLAAASVFVPGSAYSMIYPPTKKDIFVAPHYSAIYIAE